MFCWWYPQQKSNSRFGQYSPVEFGLTKVNVAQIVYEINAPASKTVAHLKDEWEYAAWNTGSSNPQMYKSKSALWLFRKTEEKN